MKLDIRIPLGLFFLSLGVILAGYGVATSGSDMYTASMGGNVNLSWGLVMLVFGATFYGAGTRSARKLR